MRYTPAGLPVLGMQIEHQSQTLEAETMRQVSATVKAVAVGAIAERLVQQAVGSVRTFRGFLATPRNGKGLVFHIQEFSLD